MLVALEASWVTFGKQFGLIFGMLFGVPMRKARFLIKSIKPVKKMLMSFRGVEIEAKPDPETASGRDWEAPGSDLGAMLVPKISPVRGPETSCCWDRFLGGPKGGQLPAGWGWAEAPLG